MPYQYQFIAFTAQYTHWWFSFLPNCHFTVIMLQSASIYRVTFPGSQIQYRGTRIISPGIRICMIFDKDSKKFYYLFEMACCIGGPKLRLVSVNSDTIHDEPFFNGVGRIRCLVNGCYSPCIMPGQIRHLCCSLYWYFSAKLRSSNHQLIPRGAGALVGHHCSRCAGQSKIKFWAISGLA